MKEKEKFARDDIYKSKTAMSTHEKRGTITLRNVN